MDTAVELDLTVLLPTRRGDALDVRVTVPAGTTLADLLPLLAQAAGAEIRHVTSRGVAVPVTSVVGMPPLLHGATLVVGEPARPSASRATPTDLVVVGGPDAGRRRPLPADGLVVGRSAGLGLSLDDDRLSRRHVSIVPSDNGFRVIDLASTNGTRCGDVTLGADADADETVVDGSDLLAVGSSLLRLDRTGGACAPTSPDGTGRLAVNRAPRTLPPEVASTVRSPTPPGPPRRVRIPWLAALLPLPFAALLALVIGPQMLAFALLSPLMVVGSVLTDRFGARRDHVLEVEAHETLLAERRQELGRLLGLERRQRWHAAPDAATLLAVATGPGTRLWERRPDSPDAGRLRVGVGELPARTGWAPPSDDIEHPLLCDVPVEVDLEHVGGLGVAGRAPEVGAVLRHLVGQLAVLHSPRDLGLVVPDAGGDSALGWVRWLPHTTAYGSVERCVDVVREVVTQREEERHGGAAVAWPRIVVVLAGADDAHPDLLDLVERGRGLGVRCLVGAGHVGALPGSCHAVVGLGQGVDGSARLDIDGADPVPAFVPDLVGSWWGERVGRALASLVDPSGAGEGLRDDVDLLDLVDWLDAGEARSASPGAVDDVVRHWGSVGGRPVARLGRRAGGEWLVDLASDGPHLLVGGTTGSGKSELLRTLVTSLALECSPDDVSFVLVDYKGGSAFGECADLPHTVGSVTNLDEGLAARALVSLGAEVTRRERLLAEAGARDFDAYRRGASGSAAASGGHSSQPLPRLVIVVDEFRMLAEELPDFVEGVVALAAVGRSLGVHVVLATQRPGGAVTPDIAANVNLRIAMRVRDAADSHDVVGVADAARISPGTPGRGVARGGDGALVEFQAARVGAGGGHAGATVTVLGPDGEPRGRVVAGPAVDDSVARSDEDVLDAHGTGGASRGEGGPSAVLASLVDLLRAAASKAGASSPHRPWLPPLPERLDSSTLRADGLGLVDLPAAQQQSVLALGSEGHWLVVGGPRSGRTAALRTALAAHLARWGTGHAWVLDTSGELADLEALPEVGAVVRADDGSRVRRLLAGLRARGAAAAAGSAPPPGLLLVDGWDRLDTATDLGFGGVHDDLLDLLRSGDPTLRVVVTGDRSTLSSRLGSVVTETLLLPLADPADATYAGLSRRDLPSTRTPGRALRLRDRAEVQLALRDPVAESVDRSAATGPPPFAVADLPVRIDRAGLTALPRPVAGPEALPIGLSADTAGLAVLDPARDGRRILVAGHPRTGRSTTLATIGVAAVEAGRTVAVVEGAAGSVAAAVLVAVGQGAGKEGGCLRIDPWDPQPLVEARRTRPDLVVLVDDADRLEGTPVESVLVELASLVDRDGGLVVASCATTSAAAQFRGVIPTVGRSQSGLLLAPRTPGDGEVFGIRAPRGMTAVPGRALQVGARETRELQVATPWTASTHGAAASAPRTAAGAPGEPERLRSATRCA